MKKSEDLKALLEQLRTETSYMEESPGEDIQGHDRPQLPIRTAVPPVSDKTPVRPPIFQRTALRDPQPASRFNAVWSENKESLLFCLLASACVILTGVLSQKEYVTLAGTISFVLFSIVSFAAFFRYVSTSSSAENLQPQSFRYEPQKHYPSTMSADKERELEGKIEELRSVIKALSRQQGKNI